MKRSCFVWAMVLLPSHALAQGSSVAWCNLYGGFGRGSVGGSVVTSMVGDVAAGSMTAADTRIVAGFLANRQTWGSVTAIDDGSIAIPRAIELMQNFPNPFNPSTIIRYALPRASLVTLTLFNALGQRVTVLAEGEREAGYHEVRLEGRGLASGVYFYRLQARPLAPGAVSDFLQTRRLLLLK